MVVPFRPPLASLHHRLTLLHRHLVLSQHRHGAHTKARRTSANVDMNASLGAHVTTKISECTNDRCSDGAAVAAADSNDDTPDDCEDAHNARAQHNAVFAATTLSPSSLADATYEAAHVVIARCYKAVLSFLSSFPSSLSGGVCALETLSRRVYSQKLASSVPVLDMSVERLWYLQLALSLLLVKYALRTLFGLVMLAGGWIKERRKTRIAVLTPSSPSSPSSPEARDRQWGWLGAGRGGESLGGHPCATTERVLRRPPQAQSNARGLRADIGIDISIRCSVGIGC